MIAAVGPGGHFGRSHTAAHVRHEFFMPDIADRLPREAWEAAGSSDTARRAKQAAIKILKEHNPLGFEPDLEKMLVEKYAGIKQIQI